MRLEELSYHKTRYMVRRYTKVKTMIDDLIAFVIFDHIITFEDTFIAFSLLKKKRIVMLKVRKSKYWLLK